MLNILDECAHVETFDLEMGKISKTCQLLDVRDSSLIFNWASKLKRACKSFRLILITETNV